MGPPIGRSHPPRCATHRSVSMRCRIRQKKPYRSCAECSARFQTRGCLRKTHREAARPASHPPDGPNYRSAKRLFLEKSLTSILPESPLHQHSSECSRTMPKENNSLLKGMRAASQPRANGQARPAHEISVDGGTHLDRGGQDDIRRGRILPNGDFFQRLQNGSSWLARTALKPQSRRPRSPDEPTGCKIATFQKITPT